ncbi:MAG TPA: AMP-dependent synthetase [Gammaproteobacteria bacterium]|nr:AMP-dependent synthetase [Gammaproteobacteria bacterium]
MSRPEPKPLVRRLAEAAACHPAGEAVVQGGCRVSYGELADRAAAVAAFLRGEGLKKGERVALLVQNSPEYIAAYYGALAAGGVVVGLNTAARARDLSNWVRHCGARWLFAEASHPELAELRADLGGGTGLVLLGSDCPCPVETVRDWEALQEAHAGAGPDGLLEGEETCGEDLAAIIYTSGTTGQPKGVTLSHRNLASNIDSILEYLRLDANDRVLNVLPFYYSYGNSVMHTHLAVGGCLILENSLLYPRKVMETLVRERVTGFSGVPSTYNLLLNRVDLADYDLSSLRYLTQAGGAMAPASIERVRALVPGAEFFVMYGQTEASARLSWLPPERLEQKMGSIGIAIPGVELVLRDEHGQPVAPGETGEIWARGDNIMQGYWRDPELTDAVLHEGWLKTGDLARQDEDGYFYIVGRSTEMIKSGAHRISPKEIEEVVLELEGVEEVAAVGIPDEILGQIIKLVVVPAPGAELARREIQAHCRRQLASYKIPKQIEFVEQIPRTASGKVRRFLLQEPVMEQG